MLPKWFSVGLALMGVLLFPSASFSQEFFPQNGVMPTGWITPGFANAGWSVATDSVSQGTYSLKSNPIGNGQTAAVDVTINVASPGTVSFNYRVSSEATWDFLQFYVDGILQNQWSGESGWATANFALPAGTHTLSWRYFKDAICCVGGADAAWIDNVRLPGVPKVSTGWYHSLGLKSNGSVVAWGDNATYSQSTVPANLGSAVAVSANGYHSLALKSDGTITGWGYNAQGQVAGITSLGGTDVSATVCAGHPAYPLVASNHCAAATVAGTKAVSAGGYHSLALKSDDSVVAWGNNGSGQTTVPAGALAGVTAIAAGGHHSLALKSDGTVVGWGYNFYGQATGGGSLSGVVAIAAGFYHSMALKSDGTVWAWGYNGYGQLGNGTTTDTAVPVQVTGLTNVVAIATGTWYHALALKSDGTVWSWGGNYWSQFGNGNYTNSYTPTQATLVSGGVGIAASETHSFVLKSDGTIVPFGDNNSGLISGAAGVNLDATAPAVPTGLAANAVSASQVNLAWNAALDNESLYLAGVSSGLTAYQVFRGGVFIATVNTPTLSYSDTGLTNGTTYNYTVAACDVAGNCSAQSATASATTPDTSAPTVPAGLTAVAVSQSQINVSWNATTDNVAVSIYHVYRGGVQIATVNSPTLSLSDTGLAAATTYTYTVDACDAVPNCSTQSASATTATPDTQAPTAPTGLTANAISGSQIDLAWTASTDNVAVTAYGVYRGGVFRATVNAPTVAFSDTGLTNATNYSYTVLACDAAGNCSAQSTSANATTPDTQAPTVPANLAATVPVGVTGETQINLTWNASTDNVSVAFYQLYRDGVLQGTSGGTAFNNAGLSPSATYSFTVAACDAVGNCSAQSGSISATTRDVTAPAVPAGLTATPVSGSQINLAWTAATDNVAVTAYGVYRGGSFRATVNSPTVSYSDTGLTNATNYSYTVLACDAAGNCSAQSASNNATTFDTQAPNVPTGVAATAASQSQIDVSWTAPSDNVAVTAYRMFQNGVFRATVVAPTVNYSATGLAASTNYSYTVSACDAAGNCSAQSASASATTPDTQAPTAPTGLTATAVSGSQINLGWTAATDNVAVTAYGVYRGGVFRATVNAPTVSYSDIGLTNATNYSYTVLACDAAGNCSAQSASNNATTFDTQAPSVPTGLTATAISGSRIDIAWTASTDNVAVTAYRVSRGGVFLTTVNAAVTYSNTGLPDATTFSYTVAACDAAANCSADSSSASATTPDTTAPTVPGAFTATASSQATIDLSWTASTDNVAVTAYQVFRGGAFRATVNHPTTTFGDTGLTATTLYNYTLTACDVAGNCSATAAASATTLAANPPTTVTATVPAGVAGETQIDLNWTSTLAGVASYRVFRNGVARTTINSTNASESFADTGLSPSTTYSYTVVACDAVPNCSVPSVAASATTRDVTPPSVPASVAAVAISGSQINLSWNAATDNVAVTAYRVSRGGTFLTTVNAPTLTLSDTGLTNATTYSYTVAACDAAGNCSADSTAASATTPDTQAPSVPTGLTAVVAAGAASESQINLSWTASIDNVAVTNYQVYRGGVLQGTTAGTTFSNTGLSPATTYTFTVAACDAAGNCSAQSASSSATTLDITPPSVPTLSAVAASATQINLSWTAATDNVAVTAYRVLRGGVFRATVNAPTLTYSDTGLTTATAYSYTVMACDAAGNCSAQSNTATVTTPDTQAPTTPAGLTAAIAAGGTHSLAVRTDGTVVAFGNNGNGQSTVPGGLTGVLGVAAGGSHSLALKSDDTVVAWGLNTDGQSTVPGGLTGVASIAAGGTHSLALTNNGTVAAWGNNASGQTTVPASVTFAAAVAAGGSHSLALLTDGTVVAWGLNTDGQSTVPVGLTGVVNIAAGGSHSLALKSDGTVVAWGDVTNAVPVGLTNVTAIAAGGSHSLALKSDGTVVAWGGVNADGQTTVPVGLTGVVAIAAGGSHSLALKSDGTVVAWGRAVEGQTTVPVAVSTVSTLTATATSQTSVNLTWNASTDNVAVTYYQVYRDGVFVTSVATPNLNYSDTVPGVGTYAYTVNACDAAGNCSTQSTSASTTTPDQTAPNVPTALAAAAASQSQIDLSWTAPTDNVAVTIYRVFNVTQGLFKGTVNHPTTTFSDTGLAASTNYVYTVSACDAAGNCSAQSASANATTPDTQAPTVPTGVAAVAASQSQIDISWSASTDNVAVTAYRVFRAGVQVGTVNSPTLSFSDTGLAAATTYNYRIRACDAAGNCSALSSAASATTPDTQPPTVPTGFTATAISDSQINLAWTAATDNVAVASYQITRGGLLIQVVGGATLNYSDTGLINGTTYIYTVAACDAAGNCSAQTGASATTPDTQAPTVPTGFTAAASSQSQINLSWTAATDNVAVAAYRVSRDGVFLTTVNVPTVSVSDTGLATSTTYSYTVSACDAAANCSATAATSTTTHSVFTPSMALSWNLVGNSLDITINVVATFGNQDAPVAGVTANINSIWTWDAALDKWKYYSPQLSAAGNTNFINDPVQNPNGHVLLSTINAGEGYWVNASAPVVLPQQNGPAYSFNPTNFAALTPGGTANLGWNLISTADALTPSEFNIQVSSPAPASGVVPTNNFQSLWTWDAATSKWYFYSPLLEASGGLTAVNNYATTYNFLSFYGAGPAFTPAKTLGIGTSFWVNRP